MNKISKDNLRISTYLIKAFIAIFATYRLFAKDTSIDDKIIILSISIVLYFIISELLFEIHMRNHEDKILDLQNSVNENLNKINRTLNDSFLKIEYVIQSDSMYKKILRLESGKDSQYHKSLESFLNKLNECIDDKRSGELDKNVYYDTLEHNAKKIMNDKINSKSTNNYNGDIWALSFCLPKEWDKSDPYEKSWFETMQKVDMSGVVTKRLWVFNDHMIKLLKKPLDDESKIFLGNIEMFCKNDTQFKNTISFAISEKDINYTDINEFGKGFFATKYADGSSDLVYGVARDRIRTSSELCGEIDYNPVRRENIRGKWESYIKRAKPLIEYINEIAHDEIKEHMKKLNFV